MAYFKIINDPLDQGEKYIAMGMINVTAELYLEKGDEGYDKYIAEHLVTLEDGSTQLNPFCTHSIQFEHDATEEEILWCFEFALGITHRNYLADDLHCKKGGQVVNQNIHYLSRKAFYDGVGKIPENLRSDYMKAEMGKVEKAKEKISALKGVNLATVKTIGKYSVK